MIRTHEPGSRKHSHGEDKCSGLLAANYITVKASSKKRNKNGETAAKITYCPSSKKWIACNSHALKQFPLLTLTKEKLK